MRSALLLVLPALFFAACANKSNASNADAATVADSAALAASGSAASLPAVTRPLNPRGPQIPEGPVLAAIALDVSIYATPSKTAKKLGALRVGAVVRRSDAPVSQDGCPGGWFKLVPDGYVCEGEDAVKDANHPIARAAAVRPDATKPLPYTYAFVRATAPLYLRVPTKEEQIKSEMALDKHLEWYKRKGPEESKVVLGANDMAVPWLPAPTTQSTSLSLGQTFGAEGDFDAAPFWLQSGRKIPNIASFKVPAASVFANRVGRHTGLAFIGALKAGSDAFDRPFAITTDLRLVPTTKLKPDTGSPWHGIEITDATPLPFAFVRKPCERKAKADCPAHYRVDAESAHRGEPLPPRSIVQLSGKAKTVGKKRYRELKDGSWALAEDLGAVLEPAEWPRAAGANEKWIEVSILNQTLTLWEGKKPLFATLVSTGQDGLKDPKTTKSTVQGTFRIKNKFITATMDSNQSTGSSAGAGAAGGEGAAPAAPDADAEGKDGKRMRRGHGTFELRDVPYVQYFEGGFALHAAYWHDVFGLARSHGCVNLAPIDAQRVFSFTDPQVPEGWHAYVAPKPTDGTTIVIHP
jgi:lipoprotein-anchoring transpeptidase ErfK/SrfK